MSNHILDAQKKTTSDIECRSLPLEVLMQAARDANAGNLAAYRWLTSPTHKRDREFWLNMLGIEDADVQERIRRVGITASPEAIQQERIAEERRQHILKEMAERKERHSKRQMQIDERNHKLQMVHSLITSGMSVNKACEETGIQTQVVYKWFPILFGKDWKFHVCHCAHCGKEFSRFTLRQKRLTENTFCSQSCRRIYHRDKLKKQFGHLPKLVTRKERKDAM